jgi:hypothetical protein
LFDNLFDQKEEDEVTHHFLFRLPFAYQRKQKKKNQIETGNRSFAEHVPGNVHLESVSAKAAHPILPKECREDASECSGSVSRFF